MELLYFSLSNLTSFLFQYLGHVEVDESRGMHICEDAVKRLKAVRIHITYCQYAAFSCFSVRYVFSSKIFSLSYHM